MRRKKISAFLIVQNEEKLIENALKSIKDIVDDIVIVHDGKCKDNTLKIASKYTNKIFVEKLTRNPEFLKVKYLNKNKIENIFNNNYVLSLDADEELSPDLKKEILHLDLKDFDCYYIKRKNINENLGKLKFYLRLFNINKIKLIGFYHQDFLPLSRAKIKYLENVILHNHIYKKNKVNWARLEVYWEKHKFVNFYNCSFIDKANFKLKSFLRRSILLRKLYRGVLFKKYSHIYGPELAKKRLKYYDTVTYFLKKVK